MNAIVHAHTPSVIPFGVSAVRLQPAAAGWSPSPARSPAVFRAYYTGQDAQLEAEALRLGNPTYLSADEARRATITQAGLVARAWELWRRALPPR